MAKIQDDLKKLSRSDYNDRVLEYLFEKYQEKKMQQYVYAPIKDLQECGYKGNLPTIYSSVYDNFSVERVSRGSDKVRIVNLKIIRMKKEGEKNPEKVFREAIDKQLEKAKEEMNKLKEEYKNKGKNE